ncbi:hypothetical protein FFWV33_12180 [Flavobacterium faecale]|uniref:Peptidase M56 domain-containing protein n=1 Tax=Flavobacterium faecale TaxID=1355330 RepID=A0A2S1LEU7_9FLAO|nr:M56 family metallopeptidase [Flavobacterium faecale]AWG22219.1 hypothetical protein FFWV33_12180 [Flavobacterium faecale]
MENVLVYFMKSSGLLALFFLSYHFLLRKETFFDNNRWFLLSGLVTAALLPLLFFTKIKVVVAGLPKLNWTALPHIVEPDEKSMLAYWPQALLLMYGLVTLFLTAKMLFDFYSLRSLLKGKERQQDGDFTLIATKDNSAPFSFFKTIVYNSELYSETELSNILAHEKVHSDQNHTLDVLLSTVFCTVFWFNPFVWWYKKAILQNLEFIADHEATQNITDKRAYQITLLKITTQQPYVALTNHFYQSLIKKRIVMLNKNQSKKRNAMKYFLVVPALIAFVLVFQIKMVAQAPNSLPISGTLNTIDHTIKKDATDQELQNTTTLFKDTQDVELLISNVKRNATGEIIGIKVTFDDHMGSSGTNGQKGTRPIDPIRIVSKKMEDGTIEIGFYAEGEEVTNPRGDSDEEQSTISMGSKTKTNAQTITTSSTTTSNTTTTTERPQPAVKAVKSAVPNSKESKTTSSTHTIKILESATDGIPLDVQYYIDGKKTTKAAVDKLDPNTIDKMNVDKDTEKGNTIKITTKAAVK